MRWHLSRVSESVKMAAKMWLPWGYQFRGTEPRRAPCRAPRSPHLRGRWAQGWWGGGKSPLFWGCEQLGMLKRCSLTPSWPRARDLGGESHPWGVWGRRSRAAGGGAGAEGLMGSVCSRSLVTKEKGTALGKETKHPLPRRVISFPRSPRTSRRARGGQCHRPGWQRATGTG